MHHRYLLLIFAVISGLSGAEAAIIDFDSVVSGTVINSAFVGVQLSNPIGGDVYAREQSTFAPSLPNVASVVPPSGSGLPGQSVFAFFDAMQGAVEARFATPQSTVSIDARPVSPLEFLGTLTNRPFLEAYDANGVLLSRALYTGPLPTTAAFTVGPTETLTITSASNNIAYVRFSSQTSQSVIRTFGLFDNLMFSSLAPLILSISPSPLLAPNEPGTFFTGDFLITGENLEGATIQTDGPLTLIGVPIISADGKLITQGYKIDCCAPQDGQGFNITVTGGGGESVEIATSIVVVPEISSLGLLSLGLLGIWLRHYCGERRMGM